MKDLQKRDFWYSSLYYYIKIFYNNLFVKKRCKNLDKIPQDGAVIFAPNHTNALIDALVILFINNKKKVFVARADIFKNKHIRKILFFLKIMPINRIRDGRKNLQKNDETFEEAVYTLKNRVSFCIMPETTHQEKHLLLPISKGIARISLMAYEQIKDEFPIYIVPIGITYENLYRYKTDVFLQTSDVINISQLIKNNSHLSENEMYNCIRVNLQSKMESLILCIPNDEYYYATDTLCYINPEINESDSSFDKLEKKRMLMSKITEARKQDKQEINKLLEKAKSFYQEQVNAKIDTDSIGARSRKLGFKIFENILFVIIFFVPFLLSFIASCPTWIIGEHLVSKMKDKVFGNSFRFVLNVIVTTIIVIIAFSISIVFVKWYFVLMIITFIFYSYGLSWRYMNLLHVLISDIRLFKDKSLLKMLYELRDDLKKFQLTNF